MQVEEPTNHIIAPASDRLASTTRRLVYALALIPIVPAISVLGMWGIEEYAGQTMLGGSFDSTRYFNLFAAILWVVGTIFIWRRCVLWTLGQKWLTALIAMIPFVQAIYAQGLWVLPAKGCLDLNFRDHLLRNGQAELGFAFWMWASIWGWWYWEKRTMRKRNETSTPMDRRISPMVARLVTCIGMIPAGIGLLLIIGTACDDFLSVTDPQRHASCMTATIMVAMWLLIWRRSVVWEPRVIRRTAAATFVCLVVPLCSLWVFASGASRFLETICFTLPIIGWGIWMAWTVAIWPLRGDPLTQDESGPRCLKCNYLLHGLTATRCPECGDEPTLDQLLAATIAAPL